MINIYKRYRKDYAGEEIITERTLENQTWTAKTEYVPNNIINTQISNRAVIFGNGRSRLYYDVAHIIRHRSGLLGADTMQSYGCNAFYRDYTPNFLVVTDRIIASEILNTGAQTKNIIYTRAMINLEFPGQFYLIPHDIYSDAGTTAIYLACFDGHKRIYLVGFDNQISLGHNDNAYAGTYGYDPVHTELQDYRWINDKAELMKCYDDVDFVWVTTFGRNTMPEAWQGVTNIRQISFREFVTEADL